MLDRQRQLGGKLTPRNEMPISATLLTASRRCRGALFDVRLSSFLGYKNYEHRASIMHSSSASLPPVYPQRAITWRLQYTCVIAYVLESLSRIQVGLQHTLKMFRIRCGNGKEGVIPIYLTMRMCVNHLAVHEIWLSRSPRPSPLAVHPIWPSPGFLAGIQQLGI